MSEPLMPKKSSYIVEVTEGKSYYWCSCGRSNKQPFCDGSHKDTEFEPHKFTAEDTGKVLLCGCKRSGNRPFCDGSHHKL